MIKIQDKTQCCGCTACYNICPKHAIIMQEDREGFDYPIVHNDLCIHCDLCEQICPLKSDSAECEKKYAVAIQNTDESIRKISSAGGFAGAVLKKWFEKGNVAYAVGLDDKNLPRFFRLENIKDCVAHRIFASKYVSCAVDDTFAKIKEDLCNETKVCFIGLPCQVAGLNNFLRGNRKNLFLIDLTCYGVPSRKLYREYLSFIEQKYRKPIKDVRFRDKTFGYSAPTMCIELADGKIKSQNSNVKSYLRAFFSHLSIRPSCFKCHFKKIDRCSDFTIGDIKDIGKHHPAFDDNLGTTCVYVHSISAELLLDELRDDTRICDLNLDQITRSKSNKMIYSATQNVQRDSFFAEIDTLSYAQLVKKYCPPKFEEKLANIIKQTFLLLGLHKSKLLKRMKEWRKKL